LGYGDFTGSLTISSSAGPEELSLSAKAIIPDIDISRSDNTTVSITSLDYHNVNMGYESTIQIVIENNPTDNYSADLVISNWSIGDQFMTDLPQGGFTIAAGSSRTVNVTYKPEEYGSVYSTLKFLSNDPDEPAYTIDLYGNSPGQLFTVVPNAPQHFTDKNGDVVQVSITSGKAEFYLNNGQYQGADIREILLSETDSSTSLKINVKGIDSSVARITSESDLGSIIAPMVSLSQGGSEDGFFEIDINGSLDKLLLNNIMDDVDIRTITPPAKSMKIKVNEINDNVTFDLAGSVKSFQAASYNSGALTASRIDNVKISSGDLGANVLANHADEGNIKNVKVKGDISGTIRAQNIKSISAMNLDQALISVQNSIRNVNIKNDVINSFVLAGYDIGTDLAGVQDDLLQMGTIGNFRFGGSFSNTYVASGAMTDNIYIGLYGSLQSNPDYSGGNGFMKVKGGDIITSNNESFGFYSAGDIKTNFNSSGNFDIERNI
jgi:hypothetical protein